MVVMAARVRYSSFRREDVRTRVEALAQQTDGFLKYMESANLQQVQKTRDRNSIELLKEIYSGAVHDG